MTCSERNDLAGAGRDGQAVRCLKITEFTYWNGSASLPELAASLAGLRPAVDVMPATLERDIALLARHGLPIEIAADGRRRIHGVVPGFALRLRRDEASAVWACCVARNLADVASKFKVSDATMADGVAVLEAALKRFHPGSEVIPESSSVLMASGEPQVAQPLNVLRTSKLCGEARLVHRRLRIVDLIESRKARGVEQLAAVLDVSHRTVHSDLTVLRHAGVDTRYCRDCREYAVMGLNRYLCGHLSLPMAEALWVCFQTPEDARDVGASPALQQASRKLACGIGLVLARRGEESAIRLPG